MARLVHPSPTVGSLIKKLTTAYPDLSVPELIQIVKEATQARGNEAGEFASAEVVSEEKAFKLARAKAREL